MVQPNNWSVWFISWQANDDGSQGLPTTVNVRSAAVIPSSRGAGGHGGTTQNNNMNFFSCLDEKSDIDIELNKVVFPKNQQDSYGSHDILCNLELSTAPLEHKFGVARLIAEIKPIMNTSKKSLLAILHRQKMKNASHQSLIWNDD